MYNDILKRLNEVNDVKVWAMSPERSRSWDTCWDWKSETSLKKNRKPSQKTAF